MIDLGNGHFVRAKAHPALLELRGMTGIRASASRSLGSALSPLAVLRRRRDAVFWREGRQRRAAAVDAAPAREPHRQ